MSNADVCVARNGSIYELPRQINFLLRDCGYDFSEKNVPNWSRLMVLVATIQNTVLGDRLGWAWGIDPILPEMSFQSVEIESTGWQSSDARVHFTAGGKPQQMRFLIWIPNRIQGTPKRDYRYYPASDGVDEPPLRWWERLGDALRYWWHELISPRD